LSVAVVVTAGGVADPVSVATGGLPAATGTTGGLPAATVTTLVGIAAPAVTVTTDGLLVGIAAPTVTVTTDGLAVGITAPAATVTTDGLGMEPTVTVTTDGLAVGIAAPTVTVTTDGTPVKVEVVGIPLTTLTTSVTVAADPGVGMVWVWEREKRVDVCELSSDPSGRSWKLFAAARSSIESKVEVLVTSTVVSWIWVAGSGLGARFS